MPRRRALWQRIAEEARLRSGLLLSSSAASGERSVIKRFIDVGIAVKNLEAAVAIYSKVLGVAPRMLTQSDYAYPGLKGARFYLPNATISLVASDDPQSTISKFIKRRGEGVNHLTLEVISLERDVVDLTKQGIEFLTGKPVDFPEGKVIFTHPRSLHGVQIALVQPLPSIDLLQQA